MTNEMPNSDFPPSPDALTAQSETHGRAAMLLVESLIHGLIARAVITPAEAVEIVEVAIDVQEEVVALPDSDALQRSALNLLEAVAHSLSVDVPR